LVEHKTNVDRRVNNVYYREHLSNKMANNRTTIVAPLARRMMSNSLYAAATVWNSLFSGNRLDRFHIVYTNAASNSSAANNNRQRNSMYKLINVVENTMS